MEGQDMYQFSTFITIQGPVAQGTIDFKERYMRINFRKAYLLFRMICYVQTAVLFWAF